MTAKNALSSRPPHAIEQALKRLGANLRVARIRRGLTVRQAAEKKRAEEEAKKMTKEQFDAANKSKNTPPPKVARSKSPQVDVPGNPSSGSYCSTGGE